MESRNERGWGEKDRGARKRKDRSGTVGHKEVDGEMAKERKEKKKKERRDVRVSGRDGNRNERKKVEGGEEVMV